MNGKASLYTSILAVGFLVFATAGQAQEYTYDNGYIRFVDGSVSLQRAQNPEPEPGSINLPVLPGDRLWTTASSFAEVRFVDGTLVRLGEETKVDFMAFGAEPNLRLWNGSIVVKVSSESARVRIDTPSGSVYQQTAGTYRVDVIDGVTTTVSVLEGVAELASEQSSVLIGTGQQSTLEAGGQPQEPFVFDRAQADGLDSWSYDRDREEPRRRSVPLAEVPTEAHYYTDELDDYGTWRENEDYGSVWYPTGGGASWAPYRDGRWSYTSYGYTWVSHEPWGWAPYHYGRWGYNHYGWYWVPGRHWSPAWVSFAVGPAWIGWSPLGYHGGSVFTYNHGFYGGGRYPHYKGRPYYRGGKAVPRHVYDHGAGWNFSNKEHFGRRGKARLRASDVRSTSARARVHHQGAVLDRGMRARARTSDTLAPRGPRGNPFTNRAGVSTARARQRTGSQRSLTRSSTARRARPRQPDAFRAQAQPRTTTNRGRSRVFQAPSQTSSRARPADRASTATPRATTTRSRITQTTPNRTQARSRVFRAPSQPRATSSRGRPADRSSTARARAATTRSRVTQTTPNRTPNRTRVRSRARTFGAAPSSRSSGRRETAQRSPSRVRQRSTTPTRATPSRTRATPRSQRNVNAPSRNRSGVSRTAPRSQRSSPSRNRSRVTRTGPRTQPSSGRVGRSTRGSSRQSSGRSGGGRARGGGARRRN